MRKARPRTTQPKRMNMLLLRFILIYLSVNMGLVVRASDPMGNLRSSVFEQSDVMDDTQDRFLRTSDDNNEASGRVANNLKGDELPYYATSGKERVLALKSDHDFANIVANEIEKRRSNINENQSSGGGASGSFGGSGVGGDYQYYDPDQKGIFKFQGFKTMKPKPTKPRPTRKPINVPTPLPTRRPTGSPTSSPTARPTISPAGTPSPTALPTRQPTGNPTQLPTNVPTQSPTVPVTQPPTQNPTNNPTTGAPTPALPTSVPTTELPTVAPTTPLPTTVPTTGVPTVSPSFVPTPTLVCNPPITPTQREIRLFAIVSTVSSPADLVNQSSSQFTAFNWLVNIDGAFVCPENQLDVIQRYVMALFYYATDGDNWNECNAITSPVVAPCTTIRFLDPLNVCLWFGVNCNGGETGNIISVINEANGLGGFLPSEMSSLVELQIVSLAQNIVGETVPGSLGSINTLVDLFLNNNQFVGPLTEELFQAQALTNLFLSSNAINGVLPSNVADMPVLDTMEIENNFLEGNLPADLPDSLRFFVANNNTFQGPLPPNLADNINLVAIAVGENQISGPIPLYLGSLINLQTINLFSNLLTGPIPSVLGNLVNLRELFLHLNQLTGVMPPEICALNLDQLTADCNPGGTVVCDCCTLCFGPME